MDTLLTIVGLVVLGAWAVLWVVASGALLAHEPKPNRNRRLVDSDGGPFRPQARSH